MFWSHDQITMDHKINKGEEGPHNNELFRQSQPMKLEAEKIFWQCQPSVVAQFFQVEFPTYSSV